MRKAESELKTSGKHRGLVKTGSNIDEARAYVRKAEHYLMATAHLKGGGFSDISASTVFYSMYHCLLAIAAKFGYESRNQECTFALIRSLIEGSKIDFDEEVLNKIASVEVEHNSPKTSMELREQYQYGTSLSIRDDLYNELFELAQQVISKTKEIIEE